MNGCIFCRIVNGNLPSSKVYEDRDFLAFMDVQPVNKGHVLVIPKNHAEFVSQMQPQKVGKLLVIGEKIQRAILRSAVKCTGVNYFIADGASAGQEVPHVHLHIIPRFKNDGFGFKFPHGYENKPEREELDRIGKKIASAINLIH